MLLEKKYKVLITNRNINIFKNKYDVIRGESSLINVNDLSKGSHLKIEVKCDICDIIFNRSYKSYLYRRKKFNYDTCNKCKYEKVEKTNIDRYGVSNPFQSEEIKLKIKKTNIKRYGFDNPAKSEEVKEKMKSTNLIRYGSEYGLSNKDVRKLISETKSSKGLQRPTDQIEDYTIYRNKVNNKTKLNKVVLLKGWDGKDYYDGEYIKEYFNLHHNSKKYPTIDHKISVLNGFLNNVSVDDISDVSNLCITKRHINSSKGFKNEEDVI